MTINPDLVLGAKFGNGGGDATMIDDEEIRAVDEPKKYTMTDARDWSIHKDGEGRGINPIPYTGPAEQFDVNLEDNDLDKMWDKHAVIHFHIMFDWLLPTFNGASGFDEDGFYEFEAARMCNYMMEIIWKQAFHPKHYDPFNKWYITMDHVA